MAPQKPSPATSSTTAGPSSRHSSDVGSSKPTCSPNASGSAESTAVGSGSGPTSATSGGTGAGPLSTDISGVSFFTAVSSAGKLDSIDESDVQRPKQEALQAWTTSTQKPAKPTSSPASAGAAASRPYATDLDCFHAEARIERIVSTGHFTKVRSLADCCRNDGKVELYRWHEAECEEDRNVVIKRILRKRVYANQGLETNERTLHQKRLERDSEDTLTEIGVYSLLARQRDLPEYILRMHTVFEAGPDVWLVLEQAEGGDLFGVMQQADSGQGLPQNRLVGWMWQLMHAVGYLHRHRIGHRDISMENVLLHRDTVRLMDFGQAVRTHSKEGTELRYFVTAGKPYYRGPESYVPTQSQVQVVVPAGAKPGNVVFTRTPKGEYILEARLPASSGPQLPLVPGTITPAEPFGYAAVPADIFACGVVLFILATGLPPWRQATPSDKHFAFAYVKGLPQLLQVWDRRLPPAEQDLLCSMLRWDPSKRPTAQDCLSHQWFTPLQGTPVPTHRASAAAAARTPPASPTAATRPAASASAIEQEDLARRLLLGVNAGTMDMGAGGDAYAQGEGEWSELMGQWSELTSQTGYSADYYCQPQDVCRGEADVQASLAGEPLEAVAVGDFYGSRADEGGEVQAPVPFVDQAVLEPPVLLALPLPLCLARHSATVTAASAAAPRERFDDEAVPPEVPKAEGFRFEPTTLHVSGGTPADVGNHLLSFLTTVAGAEITKVNCRKVTMKASVQGDAGVCSLKIRLYSEGQGKQAVEFQRRGGDAMALHLLYQRAVEYLEHLVRALIPEEDSRPSSQGSDRSEVDAAPLHDWADPGVKGLLKRNRRRQNPAPGATSPPAGAPAPAGGCRSYGRQLVMVP